MTFEDFTSFIQFQFKYHSILDYLILNLIYNYLAIFHNKNSNFSVIIINLMIFKNVPLIIYDFLIKIEINLYLKLNIFCPKDLIFLRFLFFL